MPELALPVQGYDNSDPMGYALPIAQPIPADIPRVYIRPEPDVIPTRDEPILHSSGKQLKAVDHDPWANFGMAGVEDKSGQSEHPLLKQLFGLGGEPRVQLWPERMVRAGVSAAGNVMSGATPQWAVDPETGDVHTSPQMIEAGLDTAALAGTGGLACITKANLGSGPFLRPALKHEVKIYKGKEGQQHLDVLPKHLEADFNQKAMTGEDISHYNFGFMNHKGQFLNREAALDYAVKEGLIDPTAGQYGALTSTLLSDSSKPGIAIEAMKKSRTLPRDNYLGDISKHTDTLHREMSPNEALEILPKSVAHGSSGPAGSSRLHYSDNPDLALGQGGNKGVKVKFNSEPFEGVINTKKPAWDMMYQNGSAEYMAQPKKNANVRDAVQSFEVDTSTLSKVQKAQYSNLINKLKEEGWEINNLDGKITASKPKFKLIPVDHDPFVGAN